MDVIDLRSDTLTRPTPAMRAAMAEAEVGDDVYGEDPTVGRLEERVAERLGKPAALFVSSGTMANLLALMTHCSPGDDVLVGEGSHTALFEAGGGPALAGVGFTVLRGDGRFDAEQVRAAVHPREYHYAPTRLVAAENTHNRAGGRLFDQKALLEVAGVAREHGLAVHLDGARLWNASIASGQPMAQLAAPVDTVSVCFSKGLGAPVGSALAGPADLIVRARRFRKMLGGGMRQAGVLAAAALHAMEHHVERLSDDHANARRLAQGLSAIEGLQCDVDAVETNIVNFRVRSGDAPTFVARAVGAGVRVHTIAPGWIRAVTYLGLTSADVDQAVTRLGQIV